MKYIANFPCSSASTDSLISTSRQGLCRAQGLQHRGEVCLVPDSGEHPSWWAGGNRWGFRSSETVSARYWGRQDCVERVSSGSRYLSPNSRNRPPLLSMLIQPGKDLLCFPRRNLLSFSHLGRRWMPGHRAPSRSWMAIWQHRMAHLVHLGRAFEDTK